MATARSQSSQGQEKHDRLPPHSQEAEQMLLGGMLHAQAAGAGDDLIAIAARVANAFYDLRHQLVMAAIARLIAANHPVEVVSVVNELGDDREAAGGIAYLSSLIESSPGASSMSYYADVVLEKYTRREIIGACTELTQEAFNEDGSTTDALAAAEHRILAIRDSLASQQEDTLLDGHGLATLAQDYIDELQTPNSESRILTGFIDLDRLVYLEAGDLCIVGARPSTGKTSLACNIMVNAAMHGIHVGMLSLEMTTKVLSLRLCSAMSGIDSSTFRKHISSEEWHRLGQAQILLSSLPIAIDYGFGLSITHAKARLSKMASQHHIKLAVVDYLQLIRPDAKGERREQEVASVVRELKAVAGQLNIPLIVLAQLNRDVERGDAPRRPRLSDIRESGATEADADEVLMLYPDNMPESPLCISTTLIVAKNRNGATGDVKLVFRKNITKFESAVEEPVPVQNNQDNLPYAE